MSATNSPGLLYCRMRSRAITLFSLPMYGDSWCRVHSRCVHDAAQCEGAVDGMVVGFSHRWTAFAEVLRNSGGRSRSGTPIGAGQGLIVTGILRMSIPEKLGQCREVGKRTGKGRS